MVLFFFFLGLLGLFSTTFAFHPPPTFTNSKVAITTSPQVVPNAYIIQLESPSNSTSNQKRQSQNSLDSTLQGIKDAGINFTVRQTFNQAPFLFHGAALQVSNGTNQSQILNVPGVQNVWPVRIFTLPKSDFSSNEPLHKLRPAKKNIANFNSTILEKFKRQKKAAIPDSFSPHMMTGVNAAHSAGFIGTGVKASRRLKKLSKWNYADLQPIGIIDTGVDYYNPILGGCFGPGCLISFGTDLVGDSYNGMSTPYPDADPFSSCRPHGTHVAGIIAALPNQYGFNGVAYGATIGMYKVFGCSDSVGEDIFLAALLLSHVDQCQVVSISIGGPGGWTKGTPTAILIDQLEAQGVVVVVAAGNAQNEGLFFSSEPASTESGLSVASVEVLDLIGYAALINGNISVPVLSILPLPLVGNFEVFFTNLNTNVPDDACKPLHSYVPNLAGKIILVQRGTCPFDDKLYNVVAFGGTTVLFFDGLTSTTVLPYPQPDFTGVTVVGGLFRSDALALLKMYKAQLAGGPVVTMSFPPGPVIPNLRDFTAGDLISFFSSFGPSNDLFGQPTIAAPGGLILSTFPLAYFGLGIISGTSMATPFIAGAVAALLSARASENLTPSQVRSILSSTAKLVSTQINTTVPYASTVLQGGGLVQLNQAIMSRTILSPNEFLLNDTANFKGNQTLTIINRQKFPVTYTFTSSAAETRLTYDNTTLVLPSLFPPAMEAPPAIVKFSTKSLNVQPGVTTSIQCYFTIPQFDPSLLPSFPVYSGWVKVQEHGYSPDGYSKVVTYTIPYFGVANAMVNMPVLDTTDIIYGPGFSYPFLIGQNGIQLTDGVVYRYGAGPVVYSRLAAGTLVFTADVVLADIPFVASVPTFTNSGASVKKERLARSYKTHRDTLYLAYDHLHIRQGIASNFSNAATLRPTYASIPIVGNIETQTYLSRDERVSGGDPNPPFTDQGFYFRDTYKKNGQDVYISPGVYYRILIRVLKIGGDAKYEDGWESWLSPSFVK